MIVRVIDIETTGIPTETVKHAVVEVGWTDVERVGDEWIVGYPKSLLCNPGRAIPPEASAVHHIRDEDVKDAQRPEQVLMALGSGNVDAFAAHRMDFDEQFFGGGDKPKVCSYKAALRIWSDSPEHGNQTLRYFLGIDDFDSFEPSLAQPPHRAGPDSYVTAHLVALLLDQVDFDAWVKWTKGPALLVRCWMHKHKGKLWSEVARDDPSYLDWIIDRSDITDKDVRATAKYWRKRTQEERATKPAADGQVNL